MKKLIQGLKEKKNSLEQLRFKEEEAERASDYNKVAELRYSAIPKMHKEIEEAQNLSINCYPSKVLKEEVDEQLILVTSKQRSCP